MWMAHGNIRNEFSVAKWRIRTWSDGGHIVTSGQIRRDRCLLNLNGRSDKEKS